MSHWKESLEQILDPGEASASHLDAGARTAARQILSEASATNEAEALLHELDRSFPIRTTGKGLLLRPAYLRGQILLEIERIEEALQCLLPLCEKLEQQGHWDQLAEIADEILQMTTNIDAARYLAKAAEEGGAKVVPEGSLKRAMDLFPDEHRICWLAAEEIERAGDAERAQALFTGCLPALVESKDLERVEEVLLRLDESRDVESTRSALHGCVKLASLKEWTLAETYLEPLLPRIKDQGIAPEAWGLFLKILPKAPADSGLRRFLMEIAPEALPGVDGVLDLLGRSSIMDPAVKVEKALKKLDQLLEFAPGYRVLHHNWGPGRIRAVEGVTLTIDFRNRPGHRMSFAIARNALRVIPPDDLRVLWLDTPDKVREMARANRADLAYLAIRELGGKATAQELRRRLTGDIIPTSSWSGWWKEARSAMEEDERFDLSESFRQTYAIRSKGASEEDLILPRLDRRRGIRANLNLLRRFLDQHPQYHDRAVKIYTPVLTRWLRDEKTHPEAAVAICLRLNRWQRLDSKSFAKSLSVFLTRGIEASVFSNEDDQRFLAIRALELDGLRREAIFFALGSRYPDIREIALKRMRDDPAEGERILADLLSRPEERPNTALTVIIETISKETEKESFLPSPWRAAASLCRLVERAGRDALREQIMRLFNKNSQLAQALREEPAPDDIQFLLEDTFKRWRESESYLFPILDFFAELGQEKLVLSVRGERTASTNRLLFQQQGAAGGYDGYYMTRATYAKLEEERNFLTRELKTTVARAIQTAREMGDLSENAEYMAAKEKQSNYMDRIQQISDQLASTTVIENVSVPEGEIGPGSRVELRAIAGEGARPGEVLAFWLLGEGDSRFGQEVLSCMAPAARPLLGKKVGDQVSVQLPGGSVVTEVISTRRELPQKEPTGQ